MQISMKYLYTKLSKDVPDIRMSIVSERIPGYSSMGILNDDGRFSDDVIYMDMLPDDPPSISKRPISIITRFERAWAFQDCNLIVVPDETDMVKLTSSVSTIIGSYLKWAGSVCEIVAEGGDLQEVIDQTSRLIDNPMLLVDSSSRVLASSGGDIVYVSPEWRYQMQYKYLPYSTMRGLIDSGEYKLMLEKKEAFRLESQSFPLPFITKGIRKDGIRQGGFMIIELYQELDACDLEIADYLGEILSISSSGNQVYPEGNQFYHSHFIKDVIEKKLVEDKVINDQLKALDLPLNGPYRIFLLDTFHENDAIRHHAMALLASSLGATCMIYQSRVLAILDVTGISLQPLMESLRRTIGSFKKNGAISEAFYEFKLIGNYHRQTRFVLDYLNKNGAHGKIASYDSMFLEHLIELDKGVIPLYAPALKLREHDRAHKTHYCQTLLVWLEHERNLVKTANALFVHRNTLVYRLERISEEIKVDFDDPNQRIRMLLSLRQIVKENDEDDASVNSTKA